MADPSPNASPVHLPVVSESAAGAAAVLPPPAREHYSYSRLHRYLQCPNSFRLHYIDHLPAVDDGEPAVFGRVLHLTWEYVMRAHVRANRIGPIDIDEATEGFKSVWSSRSLTDFGLFQEGLEMLRRWVRREGVVDYREVLGVEQEFDLRIGPHRIIGAIDRVDRIGDDAVRVRDYKSTRLPPNRRDIEDSLQLAIYDLAARQLWPWAKRVEIGHDLLRHDLVLTTERSDEQREATRQYILATIAQIEADQKFAAKPSPLCVHCDHRSQCWAYADALAAKREFVCTDEGDLAAVSREREELATLLRVLGDRKDQLDAILTARLDDQDELDLGDHRYAISITARKEHALEPTVDALAEAGLSRRYALAKLARVDGRALARLVDEIAGRIPRDKLLLLKATLEARAKRTLSSRLTVRGPRS